MSFEGCAVFEACADEPVPACLMCGHCCGPYFALYVEEADEKRWLREGRRDILARLAVERDRVRWDQEGPYDSVTGERMERCFYLTGTAGHSGLCMIHHTKPLICRDYPPGSSGICVLYDKD